MTTAHNATTAPARRHAGASDATRRTKAVNLTYVRLELRRIIRDKVGLFFTVGLPAMMYLIFGAASSYKDQDVGNGNVGMYIMISMAAYGATTATVGIGGMAAVERMQGWGRQLGLTPLRDSSYVATKSLIAIVLAAVPVALIYGIGAATGAKGTAGAWLLSALVVLGGAILFALYGLVFGMAFKSESAVSAASGSLVILAFLGNVFMPLSGLLLDIARFTPLYGYAQLARYPLTEGLAASASDITTEPLWVPVLNVGVWLVILAVLATVLVRRGRGRQ